MNEGSSLSHLIERLEKATRPDRELDCLIFESQHRLLTPERRGTYYGEPTGEYFYLDGKQMPEVAPRYTKSIDAAMTLVPRDWSKWFVLAQGLAGRCSVQLRRYEAIGTHYQNVDAGGYSPSLALCIASLKAQLSTRTNEQDDARNLSGVSSE